MWHAGIASKSPLAVTGTKAVLLRSRDLSLDQGLDYVATWNSAMLVSDDLKEAVSAQTQKRKPVFAKLWCCSLHATPCISLSNTWWVYYFQIGRWLSSRFPLFTPSHNPSSDKEEIRGPHGECGQIAISFVVVLLSMKLILLHPVTRSQDKLNLGMSKLRCRLHKGDKWIIAIDMFLQMRKRIPKTKVLGFVCVCVCVNISSLDQSKAICWRIQLAFMID